MTCRPPPRFIWSDWFRDQVVASAQGIDDVACSSWYRTPSENAAVGGDPFSQHQVGWGIDIVGAGASAVAKEARLRGLVTVNEGDHHHIQLFPAGTLRRLLG